MGMWTNAGQVWSGQLFSFAKSLLYLTSPQESGFAQFDVILKSSMS